MAGLTGNELDPRALVTDTISSDGTLEAVGGLLKKAYAAVFVLDAKKILVPMGQEFQCNDFQNEEVSYVSQLAMELRIRRKS